MLTLKECLKLARTKLRIKNTTLQHIIKDNIKYDGHESKIIEILDTWRKKEGPGATANALAQHLSTLKLPSDRANEFRRILKVDIQG